MGRDIIDSPVRGRGSPRRRSSSRRERSPARHRSSHKASSPPREKSLSRTKSPRHEKLRSPEKSPSPRTNRLGRAQAEKDSEKVNEKEHRRDRNDERAAQRERGTERQVPSERKERRLEREPEKVSKKELRRDRDWEDERAAHRERGIERQVPSERKERRLEKDQRESEKVSEKEHRGDRDWEDERAAYKERGRERQVPIERKERRSGMDEVGSGFSRSKHGRSSSPSNRHHKSRRRSRSPNRDTDMSEVMESRGLENRNGDIDSVAKMKAAEEALSTKEKEKPSFELSGKLAAETNRVRGVTLLFNEPPDAKKPDIRWRLYVFKGGEVLNEPLYVHRQSYYLFGRERRVADIPTDHPSCSKQHAVLQYRQVEKEQPDGTMLKQVRPYIMDLGSTNGTFINDNRLEPQRYFELLEKDTIKFGNSRYLDLEFVTTNEYCQLLRIKSLAVSSDM